jgi:hypothetical protein
VPEFFGRRYFCGSLGDVPFRTLDRLVSSGPRVESVGQVEGLASIWASEAGSRSTGVLASDLDVSVGDWRSAADLELAGVSLTDGEARVFAGATGFDSFYYRRTDGGVVFSSLPLPLYALAQVSIDWECWADILSLGYPLGDATPAAEVRRLAGGESLVSHPGGARLDRRRPYWLDIRPAQWKPERVVRLIAEQIPRVVVRRPVVTLSGGWDSRLLAALARTRSLRSLDAYTIATDDGKERDLELAPAVARALRARHTVLPQPEDPGPAAASFEERVFHETWMHNWLEPLAARLRERRSLVLDGLAGDVLLKNLYVPDAAVEAEHPLQAADIVFRRLVGGASFANPRLWAPSAARVLPDISRQRFLGSIDDLLEHPAGPSLWVLRTRTVRGISLSPYWMFGPECRVITPFTAPRFIETALSIPLREKTSGGYYRSVLAVGAPDVAALPSTNDPGMSTPKPRRQLEVGNLARLLKSVRKSPDAVGLLPAELRQISVAELADDPRRRRWLGTLKRASLLANWQGSLGSGLRGVGEAPW